jgi:ferritin
MAAIGERMTKALNEQVKWELFSSYLYLSMSAYFSATTLPGFAHWMRVQAVYDHEKKVTGLINGLVELAAEEKDHATLNMLQWFVNEQVEEESNASELVEKVKMVGGERGVGVLYMLDRDLGLRPAKLQPVVAAE